MRPQYIPRTPMLRHVTDQLSIGNAVDLNNRNIDIFDLVVLCAESYQPAAPERVRRFDILRAPFKDEKPDIEDLQVAQKAAKHVAISIGYGARVLCTCVAGINRSTLVAGLALKRLGTPGPEAVQMLRRARRNALTNPHFYRLVSGC